MTSTEKLHQLIETIRFCMMTTLGDDGSMHSRPMSFLEMTPNGELLFFTSEASTKVAEVRRKDEVNLGFCDPSKNVYVSVSGNARVLNDRALMERLFQPIMKNWFPGGADDPNLRLLCVEPYNAEYWDGLQGAALLLALEKEHQ